MNAPRVVVGEMVDALGYYWKTRNLWPVVLAHIFAAVAGFALALR